MKDFIRCIIFTNDVKGEENTCFENLLNYLDEVKIWLLNLGIFLVSLQILLTSRSLAEHIERTVPVFTNFHDGSKVTESVAVVRTAPNSRHTFVFEQELVASHAQLMGSRYVFQLVHVEESKHHIVPENISRPSG
jgi:hypothetical protein